MSQIFVTIKPNSRHREEVFQTDDGSLIIFTKAPATEGKANQAAIEILAKHYKVSKTQIRLVRGHKSKQKVFEVV